VYADGQLRELPQLLIGDQSRLPHEGLGENQAVSLRRALRLARPLHCSSLAAALWRAFGGGWDTSECLQTPIPVTRSDFKNSVKAGVVVVRSPPSMIEIPPQVATRCAALRCWSLSGDRIQGIYASCANAHNVAVAALPYYWGEPAASWPSTLTHPGRSNK
jgi:hypothetical protein